MKKRCRFYFDQSERQNDFFTSEKNRFASLIGWSQIWNAFSHSKIWCENLCMYKINKLQHGKRFVRDFHTHWCSIRNLTRSISDTLYFSNSCENPVHARFPWSNLYCLFFLLTFSKQQWLQNTKKHFFFKTESEGAKVYSRFNITYWYSSY